ncbi:MAG TPA: hypothetical protein P5096_01230 [Patescibacteria group bacterium]|nr:hypothetical protein [Patescibacteria group bacterium]
MENKNPKFDEKKFKTVRENAEEMYKNIGKIKCPYLDDFVHFNNEGFEHLLFKSWNRGRSEVEQYNRLRLLHLVPEIITKSHTLQEYDERNMLVRQKVNSRWEKRAKLVRYYVFVAIIKEVRIKVVVKEIEGGVKFFYSMYPSWIEFVDANGNKKRKLSSTDFEE